MFVACRESGFSKRDQFGWISTGKHLFFACMTNSYGRKSGFKLGGFRLVKFHKNDFKDQEVAYMLHGQCHCGVIQFDIPDQAVHSTICHCTDCRRQSGAPLLAWAMVPADRVQVQGDPSIYRSSETGRRSFCGACGTGLFFTNAPLEKMGMIQVRIAALDHPDAISPAMQVQTADQVEWMAFAHELPAFKRFPEQ